MRVTLGVAVGAIVLAYAVLSGVWVSTNSSWYVSLEQPAWQPPPWVFGLVWPYNFLALLLVGVLLAATGSMGRAGAFTLILGGTVALAVSWAYLFYVPHSLTWATICLAAATVLTVPLVVIAWTSRPWLGVILLPYQAWLCIATSLSWAYASQGR